MKRPVLAAFLLLAGCGDAEKAPVPQQPQEAVAQSTTGTPAREVELAGRWAVNQRMCRTGWWDFSETEVRTAGELRCSINSQERTLHRVKLELSCMGEGLPSVETWQLRILDRERLSVTRDAAPAVLLMRCPVN